MTEFPFADAPWPTGCVYPMGIAQISIPRNRTGQPITAAIKTDCTFIVHNIRRSN